MSNPVSRFRFDLHKLPAEFVNYFVNDAAGAHRTEIENLPAGSSVVIDVTRDIFTGIIEIEPEAFVMNPLDGLGIVAGLTTDSMTPEILAGALKTEPRIIAPLSDTETFLTLWKAAIDKKIELLSKKFENILLLEIYFTHKKASFERSSPFTSDDAAIRNSILSSMYEHLRDNSKINIISIEKDHMLTGRHVAWGGPFYTHFIDETYALFCDAATEVLTQGKQTDRSFLTNTAIDRAKKYEDARHALKNMEERYREARRALEISENKNFETKDMLQKLENETTKRIESLVEALSKTIPQSEFDQQVNIITEREAELEQYKAIAIEQANQLGQAHARIAEYSKNQEKLGADIIAAQAPLLARISKSTARRTYTLRRKLGLTPRL